MLLLIFPKSILVKWFTFTFWQKKNYCTDAGGCCLSEYYRLSYLTRSITYSLGAFLTSCPLIFINWSPGNNLSTLGPPTTSDVMFNFLHAEKFFTIFSHLLFFSKSNFKSKKGHNSVKIIQMISKFNLTCILQCLTHISLASFLWDICKQFKTRSDAAFLKVHST